MKLDILEKVHETGSLTIIVQPVISILLSAINDWPNPVVSTEDYESEVYKLVGEDINKRKIEDFISRIDFSTRAWEAESLSQLLEVYNYYEETVQLSAIFLDLKEKVEGK